jgi:hypothetical protein
MEKKKSYRTRNNQDLLEQRKRILKNLDEKSQRLQELR